MENNKTNRYFKGIQKETIICKVLQKYIEEKRQCSSFLKLRKNKQASIDFLWRLYDKEWTIIELAVEVRSLNINKEDMWNFIKLPISKLNELMKFWRMWKESYIVYLLNDKVWFISWEYYLKHNFEISNDYKFIKLPIQNFKLCGDYKT